MAGAELLGLLGAEPEQWFADAGGSDAQLSAAQIDELLAQRAQARADKDYAAADQIREQLTEAGVEIEDTASGARWRYL